MASELEKPASVAELIDAFEKAVKALACCTTRDEAFAGPYGDVERSRKALLTTLSLKAEADAAEIAELREKVAELERERDDAITAARLLQEQFVAQSEHDAKSLAAVRRIEALTATITRVWAALGNPAYEALDGKSINEVVENYVTRAEAAEAALAEAVKGLRVATEWLELAEGRVFNTTAFQTFMAEIASFLSRHGGDNA